MGIQIVIPQKGNAELVLQDVDHGFAEIAAFRLLTIHGDGPSGRRQYRLRADGFNPVLVARMLSAILSDDERVELFRRLVEAARSRYNDGEPFVGQVFDDLADAFVQQGA